METILKNCIPINLFSKNLIIFTNNPVTAEIVDEPEHYLYSSARDYIGEKGLIDVILID